MQGGGIRFYPLYWIYHDQWKYRFTNPLTGGYTECLHDGHMHFWMMEMQTNNNKQQAFTGNQTYTFKLNDLWSPRSNDKNQQNNFRIVGRPKWYFYIEEYWRRVYIQQWEDLDNDENPTIVGKKGIKYDASKSFHTNGPFREGKDNFAFFSDLCRALPIEYWRNDEKSIRNHYLRYGDGVLSQKQFQFNFYSDIDEDENRDKWLIPVGSLAGKDPGAGGNPNENVARRTAYSDNYYLYPTLEYQKVTHLNWERLPGYNDRDVEDEDTGEEFGDGFNLTISIPYSIDGIIQSPFSDDAQVVYPPGNYFHNVVDEENKIKYKGASDPPSEFDPPLGKEGQIVEFNVPNTSWPIDGKWVEQCLGAIIHAKAKVIMEDVWGGRFVNWIHKTYFHNSEQFEGTNQDEQLS